MIDIQICEGDHFEGADDLGIASMPCVPRVGDTITQPVSQIFKVKAVDHYQSRLNGDYQVRVLVEHIGSEHPGPMPMAFG